MSPALHTTVEVPLTSIVYRKPTNEEIRSLDFEYQGGLELMYWLSKLEADTLTKEITLQALKDAFDGLNATTEYPIAEYNSVWHATFGLSIVFAELLKYEAGWEWVMIENSSTIDVGWSMLSPDKRYGINIEQLFYGRIMSNSPVDVPEQYASIEKAGADKTNNNDSILFFKLP